MPYTEDDFDAPMDSAERARYTAWREAEAKAEADAAAARAPSTGGLLRGPR